MLNSKGFDEWAAGYDASVRHSHDAGNIPSRATMRCCLLSRPV